MTILFLEIKPQGMSANSVADIPWEARHTLINGEFYGVSVEFTIGNGEITIAINGAFDAEDAEVPHQMRFRVVRETIRLWKKLLKLLPPGLYHCVPGGGTVEEIEAKERFYLSQGFQYAKPTLKAFRKGLDEEHSMLLDAELAEQGNAEQALMAISEKYSSWI